MLRRINPRPLISITMEQMMPFLDYEPGIFDGIHLWDLPDHLDNKALTGLLKKCATLLTPTGLIMMIASNSEKPQHQFQYLLIEKEDAVTLKKVMTYELPYYHRANRDIHLMMEPMMQHSSFICLNGIREFLFKR